MQLETWYLWDLIQVELIEGLLGLKAQSVGAWALAQLVIYLPNPTINPSKRLTNRHLLSLHDDYEVQKQNKRIPLNGKQEVERRGGVTKPSANNVRFIAFYYLLWIQLRHEEEERMCDNYKSFLRLQIEHPRRNGDVTEAKNIFHIRAFEELQWHDLLRLVASSPTTPPPSCTVLYLQSPDNCFTISRGTSSSVYNCPSFQLSYAQQQQLDLFLVLRIIAKATP